MRPGIEHTSSWIPVGLITVEPQWKLPEILLIQAMTLQVLEGPLVPPNCRQILFIIILVISPMILGSLALQMTKKEKNQSGSNRSKRCIGSCISKSSKNKRKDIAIYLPKAQERGWGRGPASLYCKGCSQQKLRCLVLNL